MYLVQLHSSGFFFFPPHLTFLMLPANSCHHQCATYAHTSVLLILPTFLFVLLALESFSLILSLIYYITFCKNSFLLPRCMSSLIVNEGYAVADGNSLLLSFHYLVHLHVVTVKTRVTLVQAVHGVSAG